MKKVLSIILAAALAIVFTACGVTKNTDTGVVVDTSSNIGTSDGTYTGAVVGTSAETVVTAESAVTDSDITAEETTEAFSFTTEDGTFEIGGNIYTITSAGTYAAMGLLNGQIVVDAGEDDEVVIELSGVTITYGDDSPIKIISAGNVDISAKKGTENVINDTRSAKTTDDDSQGNGAIYAKCDLKLKGSGTLVVNASYNNGIHTTDDLKIQKLSLKVTAYNNALKGNDSVTIASGAVVAISTNGDGIKTENTDVSKNGVTRGDITISGGSVTVYAAGDGFQAAHNFEMTVGEDGSAPNVTVYTGSYSGYTASGASTTSYKGVKVQNELNISAGVITLKTYDDGLHADYGTSFDDGTKGKGTINISGGEINMNVYSPENKTAGGRMGPGGFGGWGGQQTVKGADGIHADNVLNISGGAINIDSAYEGLEANVINISGGTTYVSANDDGVNATKGVSTPLINVTGGYLDVTVSSNGDTDGIDSNGNYKQTGGVVITRGPSSEMAAAIDADGSVSVTGGTLIVLGYGRVSTGGSVRSYSLSLHSAGTHTVKIGGTSYTFTNASAYGRTYCYSDVTVSQ
ncbi:MAG: carbohydrate-binding domain-containing protein [Clostridia bacterium]|nr:carbohydrate-binding domain-containing protein [Clostridia bacterium]